VAQCLCVKFGLVWLFALAIASAFLLTACCAESFPPATAGAPKITISPKPTLWCGEANCDGLLPYPTATEPPPNVEWTLTLDGVGVTTPMTYTYQELAGMMSNGVSLVPSAMPDWVEMPADETEWAGWEGVYVNRLLPDDVRYSSTITITSIRFIADDGQVVELDNPWHGNTPIIALKNGKGDWLANSLDSRGPVRLIIVGKPLDLWIYRIVKIVIESEPTS
jgi:hypothetical protein